MEMYLVFQKLPKKRKDSQTGLLFSRFCVQGMKQLPDERYCGNGYYILTKKNSKICVQSY